MRIRNIIHKGLRKLVLNGDGSKLDSVIVPKLIRMLAFLQDMENEDELHTIPHWKAHRLSGGRKGTWSLHVTKNWRLTFKVDKDEIEIIDLDYEDYH